MYEFLEQTHEHVVGLKITGRLTKSEYITMAQHLKSVMAEHQKLSILIDMNEFQSFEKAIIWYDLKFTLKYYKLYDKVALVGCSKCLGALTKMSCLLFGCKVNLYQKKHHDAAWSWLKSA